MFSDPLASARPWVLTAVSRAPREQPGPAQPPSSYRTRARAPEMPGAQSPEPTRRWRGGKVCSKHVWPMSPGLPEATRNLPPSFTGSSRETPTLCPAHPVSRRCDLAVDRARSRGDGAPRCVGSTVCGRQHPERPTDKGDAQRTRGADPHRLSPAPSTRGTEKPPQPCLFSSL